MNNSEINTAYDKMLNGEPFTKEEMTKIAEMEDIPMSEEDKAAIEQAKKDVEDNKDIVGEKKIATVEVDPVTEKRRVVSIDDENTGLHKITETFDEYLERHKDDEYVEAELEDDTIEAALKAQYKDLSDSDLMALGSLVRDWHDKKINASEAWNRLPVTMQAAYNKQLTSSGVIFKDLPRYRKEFIKAILDELVGSIQLKQESENVDKKIAEVYKQYGNDIVSLYEAGIYEKIRTMEKAAEEIEKEEYTGDENDEEARGEFLVSKANKLAKVNGIVEALKESYRFTDMATKISRLKVKKFDISDPNRAIRSFNGKYTNSTHNINDISTIIPVLMNHCGFTKEEATEFMMCIIRYTGNMKPTVLKEHVFMYYTVANILSLSVMTNVETESKFANALVGNIKELMRIRHNHEDGLSYEPMDMTTEEIDEVLKRANEMIAESEEDDYDEEEEYEESDDEYEEDDEDEYDDESGETEDEESTEDIEG